MSINPKQSWMGLCEDVSYICNNVEDPRKFSTAVMEVLNCLNQKVLRDTAHIEECGEKSLMKPTSMEQRRLVISVSVGEL